MTVGKAQKIFACLCVLLLVVSTLPLYAISFYNHPYYDDFGFSASATRWNITKEETLRLYRDMGINMITTGADYDYILQGGIKTLETMKSVRG